MPISVSHAVSGGDDRVAVLPVGKSLAILVADGAGGTGAGGRAADALVHHVCRELARGGGLDPEAVLARADSTLLERANGGETTAVLAIVDEGGVRGASVGDSEAWLLAGGAPARLTEHQQRKPLLGSGSAVPVRFVAVAPPAGGVLLVATDGLFTYAPERRILDLIAAGAPPQALIDLVRLRSGRLPDDVAVAFATWRTSR